MSGDQQSSTDTATSFQTLQFRVADMRWRWKVWKQLFVTADGHPDAIAKRRQLMDTTAPAFFGMLQDLLRDDVLLRLCKLIDPREQGPSGKKRRNLSIEAAIAASESALGPENHGRATELLQKLKVLAAPMHDWRNWRIAHDDYLAATGEAQLPPITMDQLEIAMSSAEQIMRLIDPNSGSAEFAYGSMIGLGDGESLLNAIQRGFDSGQISTGSERPAEL